ncbi:40S ribosomal protein S15 [Pelomyxa schiedti]|nr:40S ribosomal protein S15 [Pelomyxa schiedti]
MTEETAAAAAPAAPTEPAVPMTEAESREARELKKRSFKKFEFRGVDLEHLLEMKESAVYQLLNARQRRSRTRGVKHKHIQLSKKLHNSKLHLAVGEKPKCVNTHCRDKVILPGMIGSVVGVHNGKTFNQVEIKPEMIGHYLGEFSITYKPVRHGRPGIGATHSSRFIPLK